MLLHQSREMLGEVRINTDFNIRYAVDPQVAASATDELRSYFHIGNLFVPGHAKPVMLETLR